MLTFFKTLWFTIRTIAKAVALPVVGLVHAVSAQKPIKPLLAAYAYWRLLIWTWFALCLFASIGIPSILAGLFLIDLAFIGGHIVHIALHTQEKFV